MKILFVSDSTTVSGAEIVMLGIADALAAAGHRTFAYVQASNRRLCEAFAARRVPCTATRAYSRRLIRTTANPADLLMFARSFAAAAGELTALIRREQIDLIHSISYPAAIYAALAAARTGVPHVWHEHNIKAIHPANRALYRTIGNRCRWVIGPSDAVTANLARAGIDPRVRRTIYNGIDLARFAVPANGARSVLRRELGIAEGEHAIGLFGQMLPYKGHRTLLEAAPRVFSACPATRVFFVGALENPPYERALREIVSTRGLDDRVRFTGWRQDIHDVVAAMDVVVVATTTPEPAALMLMEAGAVGRPVIATRTGGTPEIIVDGETGLLFPPGDADALAYRIVHLLRDAPFAEALGRRARARVEERFSQRLHLAQMFDAYGIPSPASSAIADADDTRTFSALPPVRSLRFR
jgi:glycosyltransferase involved in cell wall biosynthesis